MPAAPLLRASHTVRLELVARLRQEVPRFREVPVIMPVSVFARLAFEGAWQARPQDHLLPLFDDAIETESTLTALDRLLSATSVRAAEIRAVDTRR